MIENRKTIIFQRTNHIQGHPTKYLTKGPESKLDKALYLADPGSFTGMPYGPAYTTGSDPCLQLDISPEHCRRWPPQNT